MTLWLALLLLLPALADDPEDDDLLGGDGEDETLKLPTSEEPKTTEPAATEPTGEQGAQEGENPEAEGTGIDDDMVQMLPDFVSISELEQPGWLALSGYFGPTVPFKGFALSLSPRFEVGLPLKNGKWEPFASISYAFPSATGHVDDIRLPDGGAVYRMTAHAVPIGLGIRWIPPGTDEPLRPEITLLPQLIFVRSAVSGQAGDSPFGPSSQWSIRPGGAAGLALAGDVGPGTLIGGATFWIATLDGEVSGSAILTALAPSLGYRLVL